MAKEYIEREAAKARLRLWITDCVLAGNNETADRFRDCIDLLDSIPAADVSPVQLGEWIDVDTSYWRWYHDTARTVFSKSFRCSECGRKTIIREKFCPSCGTKMDKEKV